MDRCADEVRRRIPCKRGVRRRAVAVEETATVSERCQVRRRPSSAEIRFGRSGPLQGLGFQVPKVDEFWPIGSARSVHAILTKPGWQNAANFSGGSE